MRLLGGFYAATVKETAMQLEDIIRNGEERHHCIVCWITKDEPHDFASAFELTLHRIARHGQETDTDRS